MNHKTRFILLRCVLGLLIVLNMVVIYQFSAQDGTKSGETSKEVSQIVAEVTVKDFEEKQPEEQNKIIKDLHHPIRKLAHMIEFGSLGALILLLLLTWKDYLLTRYIGALVATFLYACTDEWHQTVTADRGPQFTDVLIDLSGALITCTVILAVCILIKVRKGQPLFSMKTTHYRIQVPKGTPQVRLAVASDLHGGKQERVLEALREEKPDLILIPGDLGDDRDLRDAQNPAYTFLKACAKLAPTYYSLGNHEIACYHKGNPWRHPIPVPLTDEIRERIAKTGATLLENTCVSHGDLTICGLTSGINGKKNEPDAKVLERFDQASGYRILLCHHPEYFMPFIKKTGIDLTVCGHAHGGQWRFFGRGTYAPGQGIFPKYTSGVLENRCVISRGLGNHTWIPRIYNDPELVIIDLIEIL